MPKSGPRRCRDREATREAILTGALDEFVPNGLAGARMGAIAARAAVPQGLIYHYFPSKEALFYAVIKRISGRYFEGLAEVLANAGDLTSCELLEYSIRSYFTFLRENPAFVRLLTWARTAGIWAQISAEFGDIGGRSPLLIGAERLREAQEAGMLRADLDPVHIIKLWLDACQGWFISFDVFLIEAQLDATDDLAIARIHDRQLDHICGVIMAGLAPRTGTNERG